MKSYYRQFLCIGLLIAFSCNADDNTDIAVNPPPMEGDTVKIMPLGASRVEGNPPLYQSFRYELWKDLIEADYSVDFVGTEEDLYSYPTVQNNTFDPDHEGFAGWTSSQLNAELDLWLEEIETPDIVLFSSPGGNDGFQAIPYETTLSNINSIITKIQNKNPQAVIIIEQLAPMHSSLLNDLTQERLDMMRQDIANIAENRDTESSQVIAVDMYTDFNDSYLADLLHYNETGAQFIAHRYFEVLETVLN